MRIVYPAVFGTTIMRLNPSAGITVYLILVVMFSVLLYFALRDTKRVIHAVRHGTPLSAKIVRRENGWNRGGYYCRITYEYCTDGVRQHSSFDMSFPLKRYAVGRTLSLRLDERLPQGHIMVPEAIWECTAKLFLGGLFFSLSVLMTVLDLTGHR